MRNILAIGAYERDNFGDYLFFEILSRALPKDNILPGSVISNDMRKEYGFITIPYDYVLRNHKVDAVWIVGGEIGGVNVPIALWISLGITAGGDDRVSQDVIERITELTGASLRNSRAYIPDMSVYEINKQTPLIINSAGLDNLLIETGDNIKLLNQSRAVFVRDEDSYNIARSAKTRCELSPDIVHSLPIYYKPKHTVNDGKIVIQINQDSITEHGIGAVRSMIKKVYSHQDRPIVLLPAGLANGHDSLTMYEDIVRGLDNVEVTIFSSRRPLDIVDCIAGAHLVIATSLHVRIVASAYGVPRISLKNNKVTRYATTWDSTWPYGVAINSISEVLSRLDLLGNKDLKRVDLTEAAVKAMQSLVGMLPKKDNSSALEQSILTKEWLINQQKISLNTARENYAKIKSLSKDLLDNTRKLQATQHELAVIKESKTWRARSYIVRAAKKLIKR